MALTCYDPPQLSHGSSSQKRRSGMSCDVAVASPAFSFVNTHSFLNRDTLNSKSIRS